MLTVGDIVPPVELLDASDVTVALDGDDIAGHYTILILNGDPAAPAPIAQGDHFAALFLSP